MVEVVNVAAFEGGELRRLDEKNSSSEVVLALPLGRMVVKMLKVGKDEQADIPTVASSAMQAMNPYPDEPLSVGYEIVSENERGKIVLAAALPESAGDDIAEALDAHKLKVTRVDLLPLGQLRGVWGALGAENDGARRLVLIKGRDEIALFAIDDGLPTAVRAVTDAKNLKREITLSLLEAEDFGGARPLKEILIVGDIALEMVGEFASARKVEIGEDAGLVGVGERSVDSASLNALPNSWREVLEESRFKAKLIKRLSIAAGIWLLIMGVLFGVPIAYGFMADGQKELCRAHARRYRAVSETRDKVNLVRKYSDHSRGALEIMKAISDRLPQGITLTSWNFKRDDGLTVSGEADEATEVYEFKTQIAETEVFKQLNLKGPSAGKNGKQRFDLECLYQGEEDEE